MDRQNKTGALWGIGISFLLIAAGFLILWFYIKDLNTKEHSYVIDQLSGQESDRGVFLSLGTTKRWEDQNMAEGYAFGTQYDGVILNGQGYALENWTLVIRLDEFGILDSFWNGDFVLDEENGTITVTPMDYNRVIKAGDQTTIGFVLKSRRIFEFDHMELHGYLHVTLWEHPLFGALMTLLFLWMVMSAFFFGMQLRLRKYAKQREKDGEIIIQCMNTFAGLIDAKDPYTNGHSHRVALYSAEIARRMRVPQEDIRTCYYIAMMHDCGKIGIPDAILGKPGKLTEEEREVIKSHTTTGAKILENFTAISGIQDGAHYHHERYDGKGYPEGLKGEEIPLIARIICVADSYDAMSSNRCYRPRLTEETILNELKEHAGTQFDPAIVKYMIAMIEDGFVDPILAQSRAEKEAV